MAQLPPTNAANIKSTIDAACVDQKEGIPGLTFVVVDRNGKELISHAGGKRGCNSTESMSLDNVYWIASCTKMIVGIACMQLVEQGKLALDDSEQLENLCPELKRVKVLQNDGQLVEKKIGITLRMLLSHTGTSS